MKNRYKLSKGLSIFLLCMTLFALCLGVYNCVSFYRQGYSIWTQEFGSTLVLLLMDIFWIPYLVWQIKTAE